VWTFTIPPYVSNTLAWNGAEWRIEKLSKVALCVCCDRTSLVRPGSSPACETNNNNVCDKRVRLPHPTTEKDRKPSDLGKPVVKTELSAGIIAPLFASSRLEAVMLKANIWPALATAFV
jgi:hypothetical protein